MLKQFIEKKERELIEKFKCIQGDCDGNGIVPVLVSGSRQISETEFEQTQEWEAEQCQFHAEYLFPIKSFHSQSLTDFATLLRSEIEGRINEMNELFPFIDSYHLLPDKEKMRMVGQGEVMIEFNKKFDDILALLEK